jgi:hypothetical protein
MAAVVNTEERSCEIHDLNKSNLSGQGCLHCVVLEEKLRVVLEEVESTKLIIELLRKTPLSTIE